MIEKADYVALAGFRRTLRKFLRFTEDGARMAGITPQQHQVLLAIRGSVNREWATVGELADSLQMKPNAMVGLVNRCVASNLVSRTQDESDRRVVRVSLTQRGADLLDRMTQRNLAELRNLTLIANSLEVLVVEHRNKQKSGPD